jgi:site-specific DNA-methyltransferase (cytosine-N4-specific)
MMSGTLSLQLHDYPIFPYERDLAERELAAMVGNDFASDGRRFDMKAKWKKQNLWRLTYFAHYENGDGPHDTFQHLFEKSQQATTGRRHRRQSTRYSVHGLHEYKGKFNPQVARALLNIFKADHTHRVLDPFCGSGTTLVEAAHLGIHGMGLDMNPLAVFLANTKLAALSCDVTQTRQALATVERSLSRSKILKADNCERHQYLAKWFTPEVLSDIERLRIAILERSGASADLLLAIASDLLRDWSLQDPGDLRIRRRQTPLPVQPFLEAWRVAVVAKLAVIENVQPLLRLPPPPSAAQLGDSRVSASFKKSGGKSDFVITSPPYATALPYIDTQRLSLVWIGLVPPQEIRELEATVLGSREIARGRSMLEIEMKDNAAQLPDEVFKFCGILARSVRKTDGFRRQAVPFLLYRYLSGMKSTFSNLYTNLRKGGKMAWVVGVNQTTLGGVPIVIDTPDLLSRLADDAGFVVEEPIRLQTYHRYGVHQKNAIREESILLFRR